jgi:hypothetical protein
MRRQAGHTALLAASLALAACQTSEADHAAANPVPGLLPVVAVAAKPDSEWVHWLPDLLPAIRVCGEQVPGTDGFVTTAWPMNKGRLGVRLASRDGQRFECLAQGFADSVVVEAFGPLAPDDVNTGERHPVFLLPGAPLLEGECWVWEQAEDPDGQVLGILGYSTC